MPGRMDHDIDPGALSETGLSCSLLTDMAFMPRGFRLPGFSTGLHGFEDRSAYQLKVAIAVKHLPLLMS